MLSLYGGPPATNSIVLEQINEAWEAAYPTKYDDIKILVMAEWKIMQQFPDTGTKLTTESLYATLQSRVGAVEECRDIWCPVAQTSHPRIM
eukprot:727367-Pleurochrysis_carterae.AAC.1